MPIFCQTLHIHFPFHVTNALYFWQFALLFRKELITLLFIISENFHSYFQFFQMNNSYDNVHTAVLINQCLTGSTCILRNEYGSPHYVEINTYDEHIMTETVLRCMGRNTVK